MKMKRVFPILAVLTAVLLSYALYEALVAAPTEQTMGNVQRIFYYHVPSAWTAFLLFFINFICSI
jgi:heme exporter protein C